MSAARALAAGVRAIAIDAVITRRGIVLINAGIDREVAEVVRARVAVIARGIIGRGALECFAYTGLDNAHGIRRARIASGHTASVCTAIRAGTGVAVIARSGIRLGGAGSETIADIVGARVAVVSTSGSCRSKTAVCGFIAGVLALAAARARIARVKGTLSVQAGVGAVAERSVVACRGVVLCDARARPVADIIGADVSVLGAGCAGRRETCTGGFIAR